MEDKQQTRLYTVDGGYFDYEPAVPCISGAIIGFMTSEEFRAYLEHGLELIREKVKEQGKLGWLADTSKADTFNPDDMDWIINTWNPAAYEGGVRYCAFVMPEDAFAEVNVIDYSELTTESSAIIVKHFKDLELAKTWLHEVLNKT
ncbi:hypothetical protein GCM10009122_60300 [Fulvivirga kasyanovii]|uniref:STAS/SEC14 domain-containing protein n=1 Tax=Fulvivirga kasyanovii TaxID=396812 RepID=A0ABW9RN49_9BACT|nr:hypothetical protein [Fulvivirga kasyanovii]MTI25538.1 hypothetical protein [Fulvivirga kasyanovii]